LFYIDIWGKTVPNSQQSIDNNAKAALWSVFPNSATLSDFQRNDPDVAERALPAFFDYAHENGLIPEKTQAAFEEWIRRAEEQFSSQPRLPAGFSFNDLIEKAAGSRSVNRMVETELSPISRRLNLPDIQPSMISRLRKSFNPNTRAKKNLLRVLSFWIGENHPYWGFTFITLMKLGDPARENLQTDRSEGIRMAFQIAGRGDLMDPAAVEWLKRELKETMKHLGIYSIDARLVSTAASAVFINIPKPKGHEGDWTLYAGALRNAVALSHQILIRWDLSPFSGLGNRLVIAMVAGKFVDMEIYLQAMLKARLPEGDVIRMTSFAHMCAKLSGVKIVFNHPPREVSLYDGDTITLWSIRSIWSHIYYDFVPAVVRMLPRDHPDYQAFRTSLFSADAGNNAALSSVYRHIGNTMLIIEIAKTCLAKAMFDEADHFISIVLANHPFHLVARTLRMVIRMNMALYRPGFGAAAILFEEAVNEGRFIIERCRVEDEEPYCELGQVYYCVARRLFNILVKDCAEAIPAAGIRSASELEACPPEQMERLYCEAQPILKEKIMENLQKARDCFEKGRTMAPDKGTRSLHWSFRIRALIHTLERDERSFAPQDGPGKDLRDRYGAFQKTARDFFAALGWTGESFGSAEGSPPDSDLLERVFQLFHMYDHSVLLRTYSANVKYAFGTLMFDFLPELTVGSLKTILSFLKQSEDQVRELAADAMHISTIVTCFSQVQPAHVLLERIQKASQELQARYGDKLHQEDELLLENGRSLKFTLEHFADEFFAPTPFFH
jgi:hypothetical protein